MVAIKKVSKARSAGRRDLEGGGAMRSGVHVDCVEDSGTMRAEATVVLHGWLPGIVPDWSFALTGTAVKEREP